MRGRILGFLGDESNSLCQGLEVSHAAKGLAVCTLEAMERLRVVLCIHRSRRRMPGRRSIFKDAIRGIHNDPLDRGTGEKHMHAVGVGHSTRIVLIRDP